MFMSSECFEWLNSHPYLYLELRRLDNKIVVKRNETEIALPDLHGGNS
jgi:hypothetical protein